MANPMPIPLSFVVKKASKILSGSFRPSAGIPHLDQDRFRAGPFGTNEEFLGTIHDRVHRLDPVEKQVENHLLQLHAIARHGRQILTQIRLHGDAPSRRLSAQEVEHLADDLIQVEVDFLDGACLKSARMRRTTSPASLPSRTILSAASCALAIPGGWAASQRRQA